MIVNPFYRFIDLVNFDQRINLCVAELALIETSLACLVEQNNQEIQKIEAIKRVLYETSKKRNSIELQLGSLKNSATCHEKRLMAALSPREYDCLVKEGALCVANINEKERELFDVWEVLEELELQIKIACQAYALFEIDYKSAQDNFKVRQDLLVQELAQLRLQRDGFLEGIPAEWLANYTIMRENSSNPVVPVENLGCTGCFNKIPLGFFDKLRRHVLMNCPSCHRILYIID